MLSRWHALFQLQAMGRAPCCSGEHAGLKKGPWTDEEDHKLKSFLLNNPSNSWRQVPRRAGLLRCGKSCRLRWMNYLRPDIRRGNFTAEEESMIIQLHAAVGNKWAVIASQLPGRTDNEIKNLWNTKLKKHLVFKGINPITHQPFCSTTLNNYINEWFKSIENVIVKGIMTDSSQPLTTSSITNSDTHVSSPSLSVLFQSFMPPNFQQPQPRQSKSISEDSDIRSNTRFEKDYCANEDFIDCPMMNKTDSIPSNLSVFFRDEFEDHTGNPFLDMDLVASNGPITLEEGEEYWN